jgi:hypothetical protein
MTKKLLKTVCTQNYSWYSSSKLERILSKQELEGDEIFISEKDDIVENKNILDINTKKNKILIKEYITTNNKQENCLPFTKQTLEKFINILNLNWKEQIDDQKIINLF